MEKAEKYLKFIEFSQVDASEAGMFYFVDNLEKGELIKLIKQVQKDAWNEALDKAAESAEAIEGWNTGYSGNAASVDKQSILKLKL